MSVLAVPTDTASEDATEALASSIPTLIADAMKQESNPWPALLVFGTSEDSTSYAWSTSVQIAIRPAWRPQLEAASTHEEIIAVLRLFELDAIADRLGYLRQLVEDDPDETSMVLESLRALAIFLMGERQLPDPQIGVTPDGLAQIEWRLPTNGILAMEFLSSGLIRFAAISAPAQRGVERLSVNGTLPKDAALAAVQPFTARL